MIKHIHVLLGYDSFFSGSFFVHPGVGEFLPKLNGEEEALGNSTNPVIDIPWIWWAIECAIYLNGIEELAVILELIYLTFGVEVSGPRAFTSGVGPARCAYV